MLSVIIKTVSCYKIVRFECLFSKHVTHVIVGDHMCSFVWTITNHFTPAVHEHRVMRAYLSSILLFIPKVTYTAKALLKHMGDPVKLVKGQTHRTISYLPLSHIMVQMTNVYLPIYTAGTVYFTPDAPMESFCETIIEAEPTMFFGGSW